MYTTKNPHALSRWTRLGCTAALATMMVAAAPLYAADETKADTGDRTTATSDKYPMPDRESAPVTPNERNDPSGSNLGDNQAGTEPAVSDEQARREGNTTGSESMSDQESSAGSPMRESTTGSTNTAGSDSSSSSGSTAGTDSSSSSSGSTADRTRSDDDSSMSGASGSTGSANTNHPGVTGGDIDPGPGTIMDHAPPGVTGSDAAGSSSSGAGSGTVGGSNR